MTNAKQGTENTTHTGGDTNIRTGSVDSLNTGGHTTTDTAGVHTTTTETHIGSKTTNDGDYSAWSGDSQVQAATPMSKSYSSIIQPGDDETKKYWFEKAYDGMPANDTGNLDWETVSSQAQNGHREYRDDDTSQTTMPVYDENNTPDKVTSQGDSENPDISHFEYDADGENNKTTYNSVTDTHTYNNDVVEHGFIDRADVTTYDAVTDTHTYNDVKDTGTHTGSDKVENNDSRTDREQITGRNEDPATLLARATAFIEQSSAFMWFKEQIDSCFYPGYYTDDVTEEGSALI